MLFSSLSHQLYNSCRTIHVCVVMLLLGSKSTGKGITVKYFVITFFETLRMFSFQKAKLNKPTTSRIMFINKWV